jgi:putative transposase
MKLTLQTQLLPDAEQAAILEAVVARFNEAACWLAGKAFASKVTNKFDLQRTHYADLRRRFGLSAQMAVRCIARVSDALKQDKSRLPHFRKFAAMPFDQRMMSLKGVDRISLLTLQGRIVVPVVMGSHQRDRFNMGIGQSELVRRKDGKWFLLATVKPPDRPETPATDFIGVDLGIVNIAATRDGSLHSGDGIESCRLRYHSLRRSLQRAAGARKLRGKRPRSAIDVDVADGVPFGLKRGLNTAQALAACVHRPWVPQRMMRWMAPLPRHRSAKRVSGMTRTRGATHERD